MAVSDTQIAAAIAGQFGPVVISATYELRDLKDNFVQDLTPAVISCAVSLDNDQAITRAATFQLLTSALPAGLSVSPGAQRAISVTINILVAGQRVSFPFGLFFFTDVSDAEYPGGYGIWSVQAADLSTVLADRNTQRPYTVTSGTNYMTAVQNAIAQTGVTLAMNLPTVTDTLPVDVVWPADTPWMQVVNDLLFGDNYFPIWADAQGVLTTAARIDPSTAPVAVTYSTLDEPKMLAHDIPLVRRRDTSRYPNVCTVAIDDPLRPLSSSTRTNADASSPLSTTVTGKTNLKTVTGSSNPSSRCVLSPAMCSTIATFELQDAVARAQPATFSTFLDPRRTNRETYRLVVDALENATLWRSMSWTVTLDAQNFSPVMQHTAGRASKVAIT